MMDRVLAGMLNGTVTMIITVLAGAGLSLAYLGTIEYLMPNFLAGTLHLAIGSVLGLAAGGLLRYRNDLIDR